MDFEKIILGLTYAAVGAVAALLLVGQVISLSDGTGPPPPQTAGMNQTVTPIPEAHWTDVSLPDDLSASVDKPSVATRPRSSGRAYDPPVGGTATKTKTPLDSGKLNFEVHPYDNIYQSHEYARQREAAWRERRLRDLENEIKLLRRRMRISSDQILVDETGFAR